MAGSVIVPKRFKAWSAGYWGYRCGVAAFVTNYPLSNNGGDGEWGEGYRAGYEDAAAGKVRRRKPTLGQLRMQEEYQSWRLAPSADGKEKLVTDRATHRP